MQYWQRKLQRSVTDTRRSEMRRPWPSTSGSRSHWSLAGGLTLFMWSARPSRGFRSSSSSCCSGSARSRSSTGAAAGTATRFAVYTPPFGRLVYVADPGEIKRVFTGDPEQFHAGRGERAPDGAGARQALAAVLDEDDHLRERKLLLPTSMARACAATPRRWRRSRPPRSTRGRLGPRVAMRPAMQRIGLEMILRAVIGVSDPRGSRPARRFSRHWSCLSWSQADHRASRSAVPVADRNCYVRLLRDDGLLYERSPQADRPVR